jgi:single-strand DNA-binding protein
MALPNLSGTARLYADVELRFAANGNPVTKVPLVFNSRKKNQQTNEWEDGDSFFVTGTLFKDRAEWAAEKLNRGDEVIVTGRLKTRSWEDKDGQKRSTVELMVDEIGPTLRTLIPKTQRQGGGFGQDTPPSGGRQGGQQDTYGGQGRGGQSKPADDPWATSPGQQQGFADDPPF